MHSQRCWPLSSCTNICKSTQFKTNMWRFPFWLSTVCGLLTIFDSSQLQIYRYLRFFSLVIETWYTIDESVKSHVEFIEDALMMCSLGIRLWHYLYDIHERANQAHVMPTRYHFHEPLNDVDHTYVGQWRSSPGPTMYNSPQGAG